MRLFPSSQINADNPTDSELILDISTGMDFLSSLEEVSVRQEATYVSGEGTFRSMETEELLGANRYLCCAIIVLAGTVALRVQPCVQHQRLLLRQLLYP